MGSVNVTISLPEELYRKMKEHDEVSWSAVIRNLIERKLKDMELLDKLTSRSRLSEEDVSLLAEKFDKGVARKLGLL
jgi:predicted CopG family antitoxin